MDIHVYVPYIGHAGWMTHANVISCSFQFILLCEFGNVFPRAMYLVVFLEFILLCAI